MAERAAGTLFQRIRQQPSALLLAVQLLGVLLYPVFGNSRAGTSAISMFGLLVLALAVWSVETTAWTVSISIALGVPATVFTVLQVVSSPPRGRAGARASSRPSTSMPPAA